MRAGYVVDRHFNPRPSYEGRQHLTTVLMSIIHFNPRPSYEGRPIHEHGTSRGLAFQSTPLIRGATVNESHCRPPVDYFNPRPSYEGRRFFWHTRDLKRADFNPRPSYEGRPHQTTVLVPTALTFQSTPLIRGATRIGLKHGKHLAFQSTPLIRGATCAGVRPPSPSGHFNPRPSYEGRLGECLRDGHAAIISIHAPHTRGDTLALKLITLTL